MKTFFYLSLIFAVTVFGGVSCSKPSTTDLSSTNDDNQNSNPCSGYGDCRRQCDKLFSNPGDNAACIALSTSEVDKINAVAGQLYESKIDLDELEKLDANNVKLFFTVGFDSFVNLVRGQSVGSGDGYKWENDHTDKNSLKVMQWIAEDKNIAQVILERDTSFKLGLELFQATAVVEGSSEIKIKVKDKEARTPKENPKLTGDNVTVLKVSISGLYLCTKDKNILYKKDGDSELSDCNAFNDNDKLELKKFSRPYRFLSGFLSQNSEFSDDSFIKFSADKKNEKAFEWGHKTLLEFCKEAVDEEESHVKVKTCLQTVYCIHRNIETDGNLNTDVIFGDLENYKGVVGKTSTDKCNDLKSEQQMEGLFE